MGTDRRLLTPEDIYNIPAELYPLPVLSDNVRNIFSAGIKAHSKGSYSHFMWLIAPGELASMQMTGYKKRKLKSYLGNAILKIILCSKWTELDRKIVMDTIHCELSQPWYKKMYDFLAYPGQLIGIHKMQVPGFDICSDKARYIKLVDPDYDLDYPDPVQVNEWFKNNSNYPEYGWYTPD